MTAKTINYYLTPVSPWTYLGAKRFRLLAEAHDVAVRVRLVDYGTIFPKTGGLPLPKRAPERQAYRMTELKRFRDYLDMPVVLEPDHFPSTTRLSTYTIVGAVQSLGDVAGLLASEAILSGMWAENRNMDDRDSVIEVLNRAGLNGAELVDYGTAHEDELAKIIANDTEKALADGVFGAPSYVLNGEVFWGQDRLDVLKWRLEQG